MIYKKYNIYTQGNLIMNEILKLPLDKQDAEIAPWAFNFLDDYSWKPEPTPPQKFIDYKKLPKEIRKKMNKYPQDFQALWGDPEVKDFLDAREVVRGLNYRNKEWLEYLKKNLSSEHQAALDVKLYQFKEEIQEIEQPQWND